ncbi:flagellar basal body-associated FliL family protein [Desulfovibrio sp. OttesenSCG-928-M16]|nr:flagellar basal body-associated FliL family protein [Desulfovibrio sp. OttesenSCG-928-M16]
MADDDITPKKKSKLKWIILLVLILLLAGGGAAAWFLFLQDKLMPPPGDLTPEKATVTPVAPVGTTVPMAVFTTNLADPLGKRFIRLNVEVEVADAKVAEELAAQNARVRDSILLLLSSKTYADIATTESKLMLKSEITERLNTILGPGKVYQVFITDMVIQ